MSRWVAACLALLGAAACTWRFGDPPARPEPQPTSDGGAERATCATACANVRALGGCGYNVSRCDTDCADAAKAEAKLGIAFPVACLTAASDCAAAQACN